MARRSPRQPGLTALITVMVLGSVALITAIVIAVRGATEVDIGLSALHGQQADVTLNGCVDDALLRLSRDPNFARGEAVNMKVGNGDCTVQTSEVPGTSFLTYAISVRAERGRSEKCSYVQVVVPSMQIASWKSLSCSLVTFSSSSSSSSS